MTASSQRAQQLRAEFAHVIEPGWRRRILPITLALIGLAYFGYLMVYFDVAWVGDRWRSDRAQLFILDTYAYKVHVDTRWRDTSRLKASLEGSRWERYETLPDFVTPLGDTHHRIDFGEDGHIVIGPDTVKLFFAGVAPMVARYIEGKRPSLSSVGELPDWAMVSKSKLDVRPTTHSRVQITKSKITVHRYFNGWEYFWFDFESPLRDVPILDAIGLAFSDQRVDAAQSNLSLVAGEIWHNKLWLHRDVYIALLQTVFMAVMGTLMAAVLALPLAFIAAYNVTPIGAVRFVLRRLFDTLRGIDMLIWSLIFIRAFGMGPFSGLLAIGVTDTGTLGKLMSEAIENIDKKQVEGVQSTGGNSLQRHRFGILPQILPLFISQTLYYLESNTRGAVVIGAMGAGGIGLQFLGAMRTGTSWENVAYISLIVLITVIGMDMLSARLRRMLIQ